MYPSRESRVQTNFRATVKYLTAEEIRNTHRGDAREILTQCAGKSVHDLFTIKVFESYHDRFFPKRGATRILDLGTAAGKFIRQLADSGFAELFGVDIDDYLRPANKAILREFRTADMNLESLPWPDEFFDVVTAWCVLPHLENPFHAVREVHRVLRPEGLFVFTAPYLASKPSMAYFVHYGDFKSYRATNNHLVLFTPGVIKKAILRYFDLVDTEYHFRPKIFRHFRGRARWFLYRLACRSPRWKKFLERRWAYNAAYILKRKSQ